MEDFDKKIQVAERRKKIMTRIRDRFDERIKKADDEIQSIQTQKTAHLEKEKNNGK